MNYFPTVHLVTQKRIEQDILLPEARVKQERKNGWFHRVLGPHPALRCLEGHNKIKGFISYNNVDINFVSFLKQNKNIQKETIFSHIH